MTDASAGTLSPDQLPKDTGTLVSLVIAAPDGLGGSAAEIMRLAEQLSRRFAFFEIMLLVPHRDDHAVELLGRMAEKGLQSRFLALGNLVGFDDASLRGYHQCIGDIVVMAAAEELPFLDLDMLIAPILGGARLVRMRRPKNTYQGWFISRIVRALTGFRVDTRFYRTMAINRKLLSELLASPDSLTLFRFTAGKISGYEVVVLDRPMLREGYRGLVRRIDLVARLIMAAAPRLLRQTGVACALLSIGALLALVYALAVWLLKSDVIEGWTSVTSLIAIWMSVQMAAMAMLCLGLSRLLDRNASQARYHIIDELSSGDIFQRSGLLNVEEPVPGVAARDLPEPRGR